MGSTKVLLLVSLVVFLTFFLLSVTSLPLQVDSNGDIELTTSLTERDLTTTSKRLRTETFLHEFVQRAKKGQHQRTVNKDKRINLDEQGRLTVKITLLSDKFVDEITSFINNNGGEVIAAAGDYLECVVSTTLFESLYDMEDKVHHIRTIVKPQPRTGSVTNQAAPALLVSTSVQRSGFTGAGITVGVISDSANRFGGGLASSIATFDLPPMTRQQVVKDGPTGSTDEGRAMAEIIYDIAPGVNFKYYGPSTPLDMANGIKALANAGCQVIVDDLGWFDDAWYSDGVIAAAINTVATTKKAAYFSAAGNDWGSTYEAAYTSTSSKTFGLGSGTFAYASCHNFGSNQYAILTDSGAGGWIAMQWNQKFASFGGGTVDLDLIIADHSFNPPKIIISSSGIQEGLVDPVEFAYLDVSSAKLSVCSVQATTTSTRFLLVFNNVGGNLGLGSGANFPSIYGHPLAVNAIAVATANYDQTCRATWASATSCSTGAFPTTSSYSSSGGLRTYYNSAGVFITGAPARNKPEMTGVDCGDTTFFGSDDDGNGKPNFCGTSAAAPAVAAVGALLLDKCPSTTLAALRTALVSGAKDIIPVGFDKDAGSGLVNGQTAITNLVCAGGSPSRSKTKTRTRSRSRTRSRTRSRSGSKSRSRSPSRSKSRAP